MPSTWTDVDYPASSLLTSTKMTQNQQNFHALAEGAASAPKIQCAALDADIVDGTKITDNAIGLEHMEDDSVDTDEIVDGAVENAKIGADAVDDTKIADDSIKAEHVDETEDFVTNTIDGTAGVKAGSNAAIKWKTYSFTVDGTDQTNGYVSVASGLDRTKVVGIACVNYDQPVNLWGGINATTGSHGCHAFMDSSNNLRIYVGTSTLANDVIKAIVFYTA